MKLIALSLAWLGGVYGGTVAGFPVPVAMAVVPIVLGLALASSRWRVLPDRGVAEPALPDGRGSASRPPTLAALLALALVAAGVAWLGAARYQAYHRAVVMNDPLEGMRDGGRLALRGVVDSEPQVKDVTTRWRLAVFEARPPGEQDWQPAGGNVLIYERWLSDTRYGDVLELTGKLETPPQFDRFDYREYLARQGVHSIIRYPKTAVVERDRGAPVLAEVYRWRAAIASALGQALPEPEAAIATGVLLGTRSAIPPEIEEDFRRTGTTHVLAVSGQNLTITSGLVALLVGRLLGRRHWGFLTTMLLCVWGYAMLVGFLPSVVRAAGMVTLVLLAQSAGRQRYPAEFLAVAAATMVAWEPSGLFDLGFQLSVSAMAGILLVPPLLERTASAFSLALSHEGRGDMRTRPQSPWLAGLTGYLGEAAAATIGATLISLPILALNFHLIPLAALPASLFAVPALPIILVGALVTGLAGIVAPAVAALPGMGAWLASKYLLFVVSLWATVPIASVELPDVPSAWGWVYLGAVFTLLWRASRRLRSVAPARHRPGPGLPALTFRFAGTRYGPVLVPALLGLLLIAVVTGRPGAGTVWVRFLDVGQGDAIFIETGEGHRILVDGGPSPARVLNHLGKRLPPWDESVDLLVLTHPQRDHITGLVGVLARYPVGAVLEPGERPDTAEYREWDRLIGERAIPRLEAATGTTLQVGPAELKVLHPGRPPERGPGWNPNDGSVVLRLAAHGVSVLLTGDIERFGEESLLRQGPQLATTVLKVPHHGSGTSSSAPFLDAVAPRAAVVSVGADNSFGHPAPAVMQRLASIPALRTDQDGTVQLEITPQGAVLRGERPRG